MGRRILLYLAILAGSLLFWGLFVYLFANSRIRHLRPSRRPQPGLQDQQGHAGHRSHDRCAVVDDITAIEKDRIL